MLTTIEDMLRTPWVYWTLVVAYAGTILSIVGIIVSENRNPVKSLAWVTVLLMFPIGGIVLYVFFGRSIKNTRMISRRNRRRLRELTMPEACEPDFKGMPAETRQQIQLAQSLTGSAFYGGNDVEIFDGGEKFEALERDIAGAREYINLQYYIFADDATGRRIADALMERARAGVKVRVIYDHIGSIATKNSFFRSMREAGIEVYPFFRVAFPPFATRINWRNHRKLVVIDGTVGYIGGMNIADRYTDGGKRFTGWRDTHLRITGPAVGALQYSFAVDWRFMGRELIEEGVAGVGAAGGVAATPGDAGMNLLTCGPTSEWSNISYMLLKSIGNAKKRVWVQTPYFLPTESLLKGLQAAALSRVDVRVMMPRRSDSAILTYASRSYVQECLRAGVKIYFYDGGMLHSKVVVVDDDFSSVGSANIDFRSFEHNFEANMMIYSPSVNSRLRGRFEDDQARSERVRGAEWRRRPVMHKALESIVRLMSPVL
ncbi:MAG: cardiolipin synthase [Paramuribaculum sp.]|nr:cardiolipin synthase [Paramuribaculum sp.]